MTTTTELRAVVSKIVDEGCGVRTLRLEFPEETRFSFVPGQFVLVSLPDEPGIQRPYSIGSSPLEPGHVEITLSGVARLSMRLLSLKGGESVRINGPHGRWTYRDEFRHAVMVSEGTGIAPFRSMIRYVLDKGLPNKVSLFYAERSPSCVLYRRELEEFGRRGARIHVSILERGEEPWEGPVGPITAETLRRELGAEFQEAVYLLCGPSHLTDSLGPALLKAGVPAQRLLAEKWGHY